MDICFIKTEKGTQIHPASIHGMLWLQTHFENSHWDAIAASQVLLAQASTSQLSLDAEKAGLELTYMSAKPIAGNL
mgnify:CR=1 FL=1